MQKLNFGGSSVPSSILYSESRLVFTPRYPSSVAIEPATIRISSLHLFQIISFTLRCCLCKSCKVFHAQA